MYFNSFPRAGYKWHDISGWELIITFRLRVSLSLDSPLRACVRACACVRVCLFICVCVCLCVRPWIWNAAADSVVRLQSAVYVRARRNQKPRTIRSLVRFCARNRPSVGPCDCVLSLESGHRQSITAITLDAPRPALRSYPSEFRARGRMIDEDVTKRKAWTRVRGEVWKRKTILLEQ